jgi:hypothetical protein
MARCAHSPRKAGGPRRRWLAAVPRRFRGANPAPRNPSLFTRKRTGLPRTAARSPRPAPDQARHSTRQAGHGTVCPAQSPKTSSHLRRDGWRFSVPSPLTSPPQKAERGRSTTTPLQTTSQIKTKTKSQSQDQSQSQSQSQNQKSKSKSKPEVKVKISVVDEQQMATGSNQPSGREQHHTQREAVPSGRGPPFNWFG